MEWADKIWSGWIITLVTLTCLGVLVGMLDSERAYKAVSVIAVLSLILRYLAQGQKKNV